ncbi:MAG: hypothetical protein IJP34_00920 [Clostridia bacterium]|nr:hypothetical protein [Clostridia bacterium]
MKTFNSKRTLAAFVLIAIYCIFNIFSTFITTLKFSNINNTFVSLIPIFLILCYLFFEDKTFKFKKYMFPLAFGIIVYKNLYSVVVSIVGTPKNLYFEKEIIILFAISLFLLLFNISCFIGTLFNFRFSIFLRIGCIGYILTTIIMPIYEFISLGGMEYVNSVPEDISPINITALAKLLSIVLFYIAIFVYSMDKKHSDLV